MVALCFSPDARLQVSQPLVRSTRMVKPSWWCVAWRVRRVSFAAHVQSIIPAAFAVKAYFASIRI